MVTDTTGEDLLKVLDRPDKMLFLKTAFSLGMCMIGVSQGAHIYECIHAFGKASSLLYGLLKGNVGKVYLQDFCLACRYTHNVKHKEIKEGLGRTHDGTIELPSRYAHTDAHSRRGDVDALGYNLLHWLCTLLPSKDNLKNPEYVSQQKSTPMESITLPMIKDFPHRDIPCGITEFLQYVTSMKFEDTPDNKRLKKILEKGVQVPGFKPGSKMLFKTPGTPRCSSLSPKQPVVQEIIPAEDSIG
ncbi:hypothetical protein MTO96_049665 [Rhipicephalus appendiculatus]